MTTRDFSLIVASDTIRYPAVPSSKHPEGKDYLVPYPDAATGARWTAQADLGWRKAQGAELTPDEDALLALDDQEEQTLYQRVLGPVYDEMVADGVKWPHLVAIARDAYFVITDNTQLADSLLAAQGEAGARANRATRRAAAKKPSAGKRKAGSKSSRASGATKARTRDQASTSSSTTPDPAPARDPEAAASA